MQIDATVRVRTVAWFATAIVLSILATLLVTQAWTADAAPGDDDSTFVPVTPCRLFDFRSGVNNVGAKSSPLGAGEANRYTQSVTGSNGDCVIPGDAVAVSMNVTIVNPSAQSNLRVFPADVATPNASNLNWLAGQSPTPNKVDVKLSGDGKIKLYNHAGTVNVLADVVGYYTAKSLQELAASPAQVVWVATSGGDYTTLSAALASITDASVSKPYVIKIAPGVYTETTTVALKTYVDIEGSGRAVTTINCGCPTGSSPGAVLAVGNIVGEIRHLTINNTGGTGDASGVYTSGATETFSMNNVTATATGGTNNFGVYNDSSSPSMNNVTATATGGTNNFGVVNLILSSPSIRDSSITGSTNSINNNGSSAKVADTTLDGTVTGTGFTCVGVYTAAFVALNTACV